LKNIVDTNLKVWYYIKVAQKEQRKFEKTFQNNLKSC